MLKKKVELRCLNCFERIEVMPGAEQITCPKCGIKYSLAWLDPEQAKIVGRL